MRSAAKLAVVDAHRAVVRALVERIVALDDLERRDQADCLAWIDGGAPLCRVAKPATPPRHLVSYAVAVDPTSMRFLLVDHRLARLWLPTGGHVEPGEDPADAARRELGEELQVDAPFLGGRPEPLMVTQALTVGQAAGHIDVSLWFAFDVGEDAVLRPDEAEFASVRWWNVEQVAEQPPAAFDPHLPRFLAKLGALLG